jgi:hypothetical protein
MPERSLEYPGLLFSLITETALTYPLENAKVRTQLPEAATQRVWSTMVEAYRSKTLSRGVSAALLSQATLFGIKGYTGAKISEMLGPSPSSIKLGVAGLAAGLVEGIVLSPLEAVKVQLIKRKSNASWKNALVDLAALPYGVFAGVQYTILRQMCAFMLPGLILS